MVIIKTKVHKTYFIKVYLQYYIKYELSYGHN